MPSHKVHAIVGKLVCGFSAKEIDKLVDKKYHHDLSRISCREFFNQASIIYKKYGEKGICYFALHHYLDKLVSIMKGKIEVKIASSFPLSFLHSREILLPYEDLEKYLKNLINDIRTGLSNEISVLSLLTIHEQLLDDPRLQKYKFYKKYPRLKEDSELLKVLIENDIDEIIRDYSLIFRRAGYSRRDAKKKASLLFEIASGYEDAIKNAKENYESDNEFMTFLNAVKQGIREAYEGILTNANKIVCILLIEDTQYWKKYFGQLYNKILNIINCNKI